MTDTLFHSVSDLVAEAARQGELELISLLIVMALALGASALALIFLVYAIW
jgi:hypothetical protein